MISTKISFYPYPNNKNQIIMTRFLIGYFMWFFVSTISAQNLPSQWKYLNEDHQLVAGQQEATGFYDEATVEDIKIYFTQADYWNKLTQNYNAKIDLPCKMIYKGVTYDSVGIRFKGQTSYFLNSSQKKSFNISMDTYKADQQIEGYQTFNLNNSWTDPTFMREVLYYHLIKKHTPVAKGNFVRLYLNDEYWGIYQNIQQLNKDFLKEWYTSNDGINFRADTPEGLMSGPGGGGGPNWGDGTAAMNYLGADTALYQKYYTLKSSGIEKPWQALIQACEALKNTPITQLESVAPRYLDVDKILWHLAAEIAFGDDDSYVYKGKMDYYLYLEEKHRRFATYDYDANSTFITDHVSWSPFYNENKVNYPLLNKLLKVPAFRQRYLAHMRTIIQELLDESIVNSLIDKYDALIKSHVFSDPKKTSSNSQYTNGLFTLKNFVKNRKTTLLSNNEVKLVGPEITEVAYIVNEVTWANIKADDDVRVQASVKHDQGISNVKLYYGVGFDALFDTLEMNDLGILGDDTANDGVYCAMMPQFEAGSLVKFYIEANANNTAKTTSFFPKGTEHQCLVYRVEAISSQNKTVVINEFMASNTGIIKDENDETEDWIELYNTTDQTIDLSGYSLTDNADNLTKFTFSDNITIDPKSYLIIWADEDQSQGIYHANFKLSANGESLFLLDKNLTILDSVSFTAQQSNLSSARIPNGVGPFLIGNHTFNKNNERVSAVESASMARFDIFPNPASQSFSVIGDFNISTLIQAYNMHHQMVKEWQMDRSNQYDVSTFNPGLYFIKIGMQIKKLLVQP